MDHEDVCFRAGEDRSGLTFLQEAPYQPLTKGKPMVFAFEGFVHIHINEKLPA